MSQIPLRPIRSIRCWSDKAKNNLIHSICGKEETQPLALINKSLYARSQEDTPPSSYLGIYKKTSTSTHNENQHLIEVIKHSLTWKTARPKTVIPIAWWAVPTCPVVSGWKFAKAIAIPTMNAMNPVMLRIWWRRNQTWTPLILFSPSNHLIHGIEERNMTASPTMVSPHAAWP